MAVARHLISASKGMRSIMEEKSETSKLKLDDMPLFLKAWKLYPCFTCHKAVMRFAGRHLQ